jgi:hypothetical protein
MSFQRNVAVIALVVLSIALIIIGIILLRMRRDAKFPADVAQCPDYYDVVRDGEQTKCVFKHTSGSDVYAFYNTMTTDCKTIIPENGEFVGSGGGGAKCSWAKQCGVTWDGITNQNKC